LIEIRVREASGKEGEGETTKDIGKVVFHLHDVIKVTLQNSK
jgi:hypothetical protein